MALVTNVASTQDVDKATSSGKPAVMYFWATWSEPCKQMDVVFEELSKDNQQLVFLRVEAEQADAVTLRYGVTMVPSFIFLQHGKVVDRLEGADPPLLADKTSCLASKATATAAATAAAAPPSKGNVVGRIKYLLTSNPVVLFMKGSADTPKCGFSGRVVEVLRQLKVPFKDVDILEDQELRQAVKDYGQWPTYPQLYVKGELLGGCDIVTDMAASGELAKELEEKLGPNYQQPQQPQRQAAQRQQRQQPAQESKEAVVSRIKSLLTKNPIMVFMKGTPDAPRCGFSRKVADALAQNSIQFGAYDILSDEPLRQELKEYSQWPTYPQVYVQGELLGGCDIVLEMQAAGDLKIGIEEMLHRT